MWIVTVLFFSLLFTGVIRIHLLNAGSRKDHVWDLVAKKISRNDLSLHDTKKVTVKKKRQIMEWKAQQGLLRVSQMSKQRVLKNNGEISLQ